MFPKKITAFLLLAWTGFWLLALPAGLISTAKHHLLPSKLVPAIPVKTQSRTPAVIKPIKTQSPTQAVAKPVKPEFREVTTGAGAALQGVATNKSLAAVNNPVAKTVSEPSRPVKTKVMPRTDQAERQSQNTAVSAYQFQMLARIISAEAKGEPFHGQVAVGAVILNRVTSSRFPKTIAANVLKSGQFEPVSNGSIWKEPTASAYRAARLALQGWDPTDGALFFFNPAKTSSRWIWSRPIVKRIGDHVFAV